jgi:hypothetical protein
MPIYEVVFGLTDIEYEVEADNADEAVDIAKNMIADDEFATFCIDRVFLADVQEQEQ